MKFNIEGKEYEVRQLNVGDLLNQASQKVKNDLREEAIKVADQLVGKERLQYLQGIPRSMPKGRELLEVTSEWFNEIDGIKWIISTAIGQDIDVNYSNVDKFTEVMTYIMGMETEEDKEENFPKAVVE